MSKRVAAQSFLGLLVLLAGRCYSVAADTTSFTADFLARYAPLILLNSSLAQSTSGGAQPSALNESNLNFQTKSNAGSSYLTTQQSLGCDTCQNPAFLRGQSPESKSIPVYTIVIQRDVNTTSVYYWLFFPFNYGRNVGLCFNNLPEALLAGLVSKVTGFFNRVFGGSSAPSVGVTGPDAKLLNSSSSQSTAKCEGFQESIGNHVGDWEHVEIKFDSRTTPPSPQYVRLSQHDGGQIYNWGDPALKIQNGTHPVAFAANGSHALYASTGVHQYTNMTILDNLIGLTDTAGQGTLWDTSEEMVVATWRSDFNYTGDQSWLAWAGKWGNAASGCTTNPINALIQKASGECPLSSGLQGPAYYMGPNVN